MLILNADDFGASDRVNQAIVEAFSQGLCSSSTIMANMPGFEDAVDLAAAHGLEDRIGIHFVLTEGRPLSMRIRSCPRFCDASGRFVLTRRQRVWRLTLVEKDALREELLAQAERCRQSGLRLTHADSHNHVHEEWGVFGVLVQVCQEAGIPWLRLARNCGRQTGWSRRIYRAVLNRRLTCRGMAGADYFGSPSDCQTLRSGKSGVWGAAVEVMLHPGYDEQGRLWDMWEKAPLAEVVTAISGYAQAVPFPYLGNTCVRQVRKME